MRVIPDDYFAALTIIAEAGGEPHDGKVAVGEVIRHRMAAKFFSDGSVIGTCFLRMQFSVWDDDVGDNALAIRVLKTEVSDPVFLDCLNAWEESETSNLVPDAVQYYAPGKVLPAWLPDFTLVNSIGHHDFLKRK